MNNEMEFKKISEEELKERLENHKKWLNNEENGVKLDLSHTDLKDVDLSYADLSYADLRYANLYEADLRYANLHEADLRYANLHEADLSCTNLSWADLSCADLSCTNLSWVNLKGVDLNKTKFYLTNLYKTKGEFIGIENIGSRGDTTHYFYNEDRIICGCFDSTMKEFENRVKEEYEKEDKEYKQYMIAIRTLKKLAELER